MARDNKNLNSLAARARIKAGRRLRNRSRAGRELPVWVVGAALFSPGDEVVSAAFGAGVALEYVLAEKNSALVLFADGKRRVAGWSITKKGSET